ncbi:hypothetical protein EDC01DRAFT_645696 [Geopyxis carbonaria]|nr:hypothetical protein EDC01DRAFT_645696 [Geopyxis carbonaria]
MDLSLTPVSTESLNASDISSLLSQSLALLSTLPLPTPLPNAPPPPAAVPTWKHAKTSGPTIMYSTTHMREPWLGRITEVPASISYEVLRRGLFTEKTATELATVMKPDDELEIVSKEEHEEWQVSVVRKLLHIQAFSAREFVQTIMGRDLPDGEGGRSGRAFVVLGKPTKMKTQGSGKVRGVYTCVEYVEELPNGEGCRFLFAVTSDAGGSIPRWVQGMAMPGQIMADSEELLQWATKESEKESSA